MPIVSNRRSTVILGFLPLFLTLKIAIVTTMSTGATINTDSEEAPTIGRCMHFLTPSYEKVLDLEQICRELDTYLACYVYDVRKIASVYPGPLPVDLFHDIHSTNAAYQGVCQELRVITPNRHCVHQKETELRTCNDDLSAVSSLLESNYYDVHTSTQYLCVALQQHASCESQVFASCDPDLGNAMENFYIAALPTTCKNLLGVSSKYDDIIFGPFWMGIPVECFPDEGDSIHNALGDSLGTTFTKLCRHYESFIPCLDEVVKRRNKTGLLYDVGAYDLFDAESQINAYRNFCPMVADLSEELECVQTTNATVTDACSLAYSEEAYDVADQTISVEERRKIMCRATVGLLKCERQAYTSCTDDAIAAYNNYNVAVLPEWCKSLSQIQSPFDALATEVFDETSVFDETTSSSITTEPEEPEKSTHLKILSVVKYTTPIIETTVLSDIRTDVLSETSNPLEFQTTSATEHTRASILWIAVIISVVMR